MSKYQPKDIPDATHMVHPVDFDPLFTQLRKENPVAWVESDDFYPFWAITKYDDIVYIEANADLFANSPVAMMLPKAVEDMLTNPAEPAKVRSLNDIDPPRNTTYRQLFGPWFGPEYLAKLRDKMAKFAKEYCDKMQSLGWKCDFAKQISKPYGTDILMSILGLPLTDGEYLSKLSAGFAAPIDPEFQRGPNESEDLFGYLKRVVDSAKANPHDGFVSFVANTAIDGQPAPEVEQLSNLMVFVVAGIESQNGILSGALLTFAQQPDILQKLRADMSLIPAAVEEMLRWNVPAKLQKRRALKDCEIRGKKIKAGDRLLLCYQSACRDEDVIEDPFTFRFDRKPNKHLAFGTGVHKCLGEYLSKLETIVMFEELIPRLESVELNGDYACLQSPLAAGPKTLPIKYKMS